MPESFSGGDRRFTMLRRLHADAHDSYSRGDIKRAQTQTDDALELAMTLDKQHFFIDLLKLRGDLHLLMQCVRDAAEDYGDLAEALHTAVAQLPREDASFAGLLALEARVLIQYAGIALFMQQPDFTDSLLGRASRLLMSDPAGGTLVTIPDHDRLAAFIPYLRSLLANIRGDAASAWQPACDAAQVFTLAHDSTNAARAETHAAETLIAYAHTLPEGGVAAGFARLARSHFHNAVQRAREADDAGALALAVLAGTRVTRVLAPSLPRQGIIQGVIDHAERPHDIMLLTQAFIALAEEFEFQGETESALVCYRKALTVVAEGDFPVLGLPALRAINRHNQFQSV